MLLLLFLHLLLPLQLLPPTPINYPRPMDDRIYSTYIVASRSRTLYIGVTGNLRARVFQHKHKLHEGFSATYNCIRLVWFESYTQIDNAIQREKQLKGWSRAKKIALIEKENPTWVDLSQPWYSHEPQAIPAGLTA